MLKLFQSFAGKWSFQRDIIHRISTSSSPFSNLNYFTPNTSSSSSTFTSAIIESPPTVVTGSAHFELKLDQDNTYQYSEEGLMKNPDGTEFNISQKYIYKYNDNEISVYFDEKPERLLHTLKFDNDNNSNNNNNNNNNNDNNDINTSTINNSSNTINNSSSSSINNSNNSNNNIAKGHHLCGCDTYDAIYQFISPREFKLVYSVVGPKKNYKITTTFSKLSL